MTILQQGESRSFTITLPADRATYAQVYVYFRQGERVVRGAALVAETGYDTLRAGTLPTEVIWDLPVDAVLTIPAGRDTTLEVWTRGVSAPLGVTGLVLATLDQPYLRVDAHPLYTGQAVTAPVPSPYITRAEGDARYQLSGGAGGAVTQRQAILYALIYG